MIDRQDWLNEVAVGMPVYDSQGHDVGTVAYVHLGANGAAATWSFAPGVGSYEDSLPAEVRAMIPRDLGYTPWECKTIRGRGPGA